MQLWPKSSARIKCDFCSRIADYVGTYFPKRSMGGMFRMVLRDYVAVARIWDLSNPTVRSNGSYFKGINCMERLIPVWLLAKKQI